jgi:hypothetical protein
MRKRIWIATTGMLLLVAGMAWAQKSTVSPHQPSPMLQTASESEFDGGFCRITQMRATPNTIPFQASNPGGAVAGGSVATVNWNIVQGRNGQRWTLRAGTVSSSFSGCPNVPASAVSIKCVSASVDGVGQVSAGCNVSNFTTLPNTLPGLSVASGDMGNANSHDYTVVLSYQLSDSWRYIAKSCPLNVTYTVDGD